MGGGTSLIISRHCMVKISKERNGCVFEAFNLRGEI